VSRRAKLAAGGLVIAGALAYLIYAGVTQSVVYFVTPSELMAAPVSGKAYRLGGMVKAGSLRWEPRTLDLAFTLSDGKVTIPVRHKGTAPDLFAEGREAPHDGSAEAGYKELIRTLRGEPPAR
jgi:cytochrome c-type biogenesis protein CcmE